MDEALVARLRAAAALALAPLPIRFAYLYGSRSSGYPRPDSDLDVAIALVEPAADLAGAQALTFRVADAFAAVGIGNTDIVVLDNAPLRFLGRVLRSRAVIYSRDEPGRVRFESRIGRMADDVEIWAAPMDRELLAAVAEGRR